MSVIRLTHEEDGQLRRLHFFEVSGARLAPAAKEMKQELRARDFRHTVREPFDGRVIWSV
jgi:hypothetical protein